MFGFTGFVGLTRVKQRKFKSLLRGAGLTLARLFRAPKQPQKEALPSGSAEDMCKKLL